ncbi:NFAT activation molecule 1 isoform X3 [Oryctolagus cuniculus]|uniref:NFAT activation molecule 1 isoform X3 n=1 Tax=Oryctolagus cuniculus TaxID=9986 RepID=UPI00387A213A
MESWSPCLVATALLALLPWTPQRAGGQSVTHIGPPIVVSLANTFVSFRCRVTCPDIQGFKNITVGYFNKDVQGHASSEKSITCRPVPGTENKTCSLECEAVIRLPGASATGTYYCSLYWQGFTVNGDGTFILVRGRVDSEGERQRERSSFSVGSPPNGRCSWRTTLIRSQEPGASPGLSCGCRAQAPGPSSIALPGHSRELAWKRGNQDRIRCPDQD